MKHAKPFGSLMVFVFCLSSSAGDSSALPVRSFQLLSAEEGIDPDTSYQNDPNYQHFKKKHKNADPWDYVHSGNPQNDFYAWVGSEKIDPGIRLFYMGEALREAGLLPEALNAYHTIMVHYPRTVQWSKDGSYYWYVAPEAVARIRKICATYPELGVQLEESFLDIKRSAGNKPEDDHVSVSPGKFVKMSLQPVKRSDFNITQSRLAGKVRLVKYNNRFWELLVDGKPFEIRGFSYLPTTVGESAHALNLRPWMQVDDNRNEKNDGLFDSWVDKNKNNVRDADEPVIGDAQLLKDMGANALRIYHGVDRAGHYDPSEYDKKLLRTLQKDDGIYSILGDFLGAYTVGSQAAWDKGTDYTDEAQKENMRAVVRAMVLDHKDEPYVLLWLLGNENQHPHTRTNAATYPEEYAKFLNEIAKMIHDLDPNHPVAIGNLNDVGLKELAQFAPEIDIYGANVYTGAYTLGSIWQSVKRIYDRPVLFTEIGCPAYAKKRDQAEKDQADYLVSNWEDIRLNLAGRTGEGNAIGGIIYEWLDEWWKTSKGNSWGDPDKHNTAGDFEGPFPDGWMHEEWLGIFGQGRGNHSPFLREPRAVYEALKQEWAKPLD